MQSERVRKMKRNAASMKKINESNAVRDGGETYCTIYAGETGIFTLRGSAKEIVEAGWKSKEV